MLTGISGTIEQLDSAVPEPTSLLVCGGLGAVIGIGNILRRRRSVLGRRMNANGSRLRLPALFLIVMTVAFLPGPVHAGTVIYDLKNDWNPPANPNGVWSYNTGNTPLPFQLIAGLPTGTPGAYIWDTNLSDHQFLPLWFQASGLFSGVQSGDIVVHTQDDGNGVGLGPANVTWTSPIAGLASISGNVWQLKNIPERSNHWSLYDNGVLLTGGDITGADAYDRTNPFDFSAGTGGPSMLQNIPVLPGDVLSLFIVSTTSNPTRDGYFVDTNLTIDVTTADTGSVPEPASLLVFAGLGTVIGLGAMRRRQSWARLASTEYPGRSTEYSVPGSSDGGRE
jgi:hypothetical protein